MGTKFMLDIHSKFEHILWANCEIYANTDYWILFGMVFLVCQTEIFVVVRRNGMHVILVWDFGRIFLQSIFMRVRFIFAVYFVAFVKF